MNERVSRNRIILALLVFLVAFGAYVFVSASPAYAKGGWPETPDKTWATNGTVFDTALSDDGKTLYVAGRFSAVRENPPGQAGDKVGRKNLAAIDVATGEVIRTWKPEATGIVDSAGTDNSVVRAIEVENGKVYFGGGFADVNGEPRNNVAAVDAIDGSIIPGFDPEVVNTNDDPRVFTILTSDSKVYIGGKFNRIDGKWRQNLAALDPATGDYDRDWDPKATREVFDLEFASDEQTIFVIGRFGSLIGSDGTTEARKTVGRLYTDTGNVHPWAVPDGGIQTTSSGAQTGWEGLVTSDRLYAGFGDKGPNYAATFRLDNGNTGNRIWKRNVAGDVYSLALTPDGKRLFFGGHFGINRLRQTACGRPVQGIGALNPDNGQWLCDWIPPLQPEFTNGNGPWEMTVVGDNQLWVGGGFTHVSGVNQTNLARFTYDPNMAEQPSEDTVPEAPKADTTKPTISKVSPRRTIRNRTPNIRATVRDRNSELSKANIKLYVDGRRIGRFSYNRRTDRLSRTTTRRLSRGLHRVRIVAVDKSGNRAARGWRFRVTR